jgi:hypothetical protein
MQSFTSQYGRKGIRVPDTCPTRAIRYKLGQTHVGTSPDEIERMIREEISQQRSKGAKGWTPAMETATVRFALWQHAENLAEYGSVMGGVR